MENKNQLPDKESPEVESPYFALQASWGITKHMGGLKATRELIELCHIDHSKYVLVVGTGTGVTPCHLAKSYGCRVVGVDLSEKMINRSNERAKREGVEKKVEFKVADALNLPFDGASFDALICESVNAFIEDKQRAISEYIRVIKPSGYIGLNEVTWLETPPTELADYLYRIMFARFLTYNDWQELLAVSGLKEIVARVYKTNALSQWIDEVRQIELLDFLRAWYRFFAMYTKSPSCRRFSKDALTIPRSIFSLFKYFGYGIYIGRK